MSYAKNCLILLLQAIAWLSLAATTYGQAQPPKPLSDEDFIALVQSRLKQVDDLRDLDEAEKGKVKDLYQQALGEMASVKRWTEKAADFEKKASNAPADLQQTNSALATLSAQPIAEIPGDTKSLEQQISKHRPNWTRGGRRWRATRAN